MKHILDPYITRMIVTEEILCLTIDLFANELFGKLSHGTGAGVSNNDVIQYTLVIP